jgi:hypothetical protein
MVKGLEVFREHFRNFADRYVLIGGAACDIAMTGAGQSVGRPKSAFAALPRHSVLRILGAIHRDRRIDPLLDVAVWVANRVNADIGALSIGGIFIILGGMSNSDHQAKLEERVIRAAEAALSRQQYVCAIDVLCGMGLLLPMHVDSWRKGRMDCLERVIQGNLHKISSSMEIFRRWAREKGLKPSETGYVRRVRSGTIPLQFSKSGDPPIEQSYRTHYISPALSEHKQEKLQEKLNRAPQPVVFQTLRDAQCSECGMEMGEGSFLLMESEQPLCLACAGFGDLEFLAAGDVALTRRATKYSARNAVVVRFSRARKRYERQGVLVETSALEKADRECAEDADERAAGRAREAVRRREEDRKLVARMAKQIGVLFPGCPAHELATIAEHTAARGSGRVGRTEAGRNLEELALTAAVVAAVRHKHTEYDKLLERGMDRATARQTVGDKIEEILAAWRM